MTWVFAVFWGVSALLPGMAPVSQPTTKAAATAKTMAGSWAAAPVANWFYVAQIVEPTLNALTEAECLLSYKKNNPLKIKGLFWYTRSDSNRGPAD